MDACVTCSEPPPIHSANQSVAGQTLVPWVSMHLWLPPSEFLLIMHRTYRCSCLGRCLLPLPTVANLPAGDRIFGCHFCALMKLFALGIKTSSPPGVAPNKGQYDSMLMDGDSILGWGLWKDMQLSSWVSSSLRSAQVPSWSPVAPDPA